MNWFRHYVGADFDPKFRTVARMSAQPIERVTFIWWAMCARQAEKGTIEGFDPEVIADYLGCDVTSVTSVTEAFRAKQMTLENTLSAWPERQYEGASTERTRRWRERKRGHGDGGVTVTSHSVTPEQNRTEQNREESEAPKAPVSLDLDAALYRHGKRILGAKSGAVITKLKTEFGHGAALEVLQLAQTKADPTEYVHGALRRGRQGTGPPRRPGRDAAAANDELAKLGS